LKPAYFFGSISILHHGEKMWRGNKICEALVCLAEMGPWLAIPVSLVGEGVRSRGLSKEDCVGQRNIRRLFVGHRLRMLNCQSDCQL